MSIITEYERAIRDALNRIDATIIVDGESPEKLKQAIRTRIGDLALPTSQPVGSLESFRTAASEQQEKTV